MEDKRYYWIKLKTDFFESDKIDFIMSQQNGSDYIVLYQMLCLKSANNNGLLGFKLGDMLLKWDENKIQRECKYFSIDTIKVALTLYKQLGLIYEGDDTLIRISNFENMVGSETKWAEYKRNTRKLDNVQNKLENVQTMSNKSIEIDIDIDKDIYKDKNKENNISINRNIKEKEKKPLKVKNTYGSLNNVKLTNEEYNKLKNMFPDYEDRIENISLYLASKGDKYKSHYATILNWSRKETKEQEQSSNKKQLPQYQVWE